MLEEFPDKDWSCSALDRLLRQIDAATGSADRKSISSRERSAQVVQSIYAKKWPNPKQIATVMKHIPKVVKFYVVTYSKSAKIKLLELAVFLFFFSARLTTLDRATAKVVLSVCPSLCHAPNSFCNIR